MATTRKDLPEDLDALRVVLIAERARAAELAVAKAKASDDAATIAHQRVQIEKLSRQLYGHGSERTVRLLDQMELAFEELESSASEDEIAAERKLYEAERKPGPMVEAACWVHARRPLFILADLAANARRRARGKTASVISPVALEAVRRIDALFYIEHSINGQSTERRWQVRREVSAPLVADLERWLRDKRPKLSRGNDLARAMDYLLKRWPTFTRFLDDGRIYLSNNAAERALRGIALGRKSWLFAGSDRGGQRAAVMHSLIVTAKLNDIDPQAWLADVLACLAEHPARDIDELLPWNWRPRSAPRSQAT